MGEGESFNKTGETLEKFAQRVSDPKVVDLVFWIGIPLALVVLAVAIYRFFKGKETKK